jgi:signal transduction histidine kinase
MNKMKECIYASMHDLSNKIAIILGTITLAKRKRCAGCVLTPLLENIADTSVAMTDIINHFRSLASKVETESLSRLDLHQKFQPDSLLVTEVQRVGNEMTLQVEVINRMSIGCSILVSSSILASSKQVINNLFFNAKKANATVMRIVGVEHESHVAIHLIDNGDGMSAETQELIGLSIASKTSTGAGVRIVKKLVLAEGAMIEWSSPGVGAGCCVTIRLTKHKCQQ